VGALKEAEALEVLSLSAAFEECWSERPPLNFCRALSFEKEMKQ